MKYFRQSTLTTLWGSRYFYSHFMDREIEAKADEAHACMTEMDNALYLSVLIPTMTLSFSSHLSESLQ